MSRSRHARSSSSTCLPSPHGLCSVHRGACTLADLQTRQYSVHLMLYGPATDARVTGRWQKSACLLIHTLPGRRLSMPCSRRIASLTQRSPSASPCQRSRTSRHRRTRRRLRAPKETRSSKANPFPSFSGDPWSTPSAPVGTNAAARIYRETLFYLSARKIKPGLHDGVRIERNAVNAFVHEPLGKIGVIGWALAADPDVFAGLAAGLDGLVQ